MRPSSGAHFNKAFDTLERIQQEATRRSFLYEIYPFYILKNI